MSFLPESIQQIHIGTPGAGTIRKHCDDALLDHLAINAQLLKHLPDNFIIQWRVPSICIIISGFTLPDSHHDNKAYKNIFFQSTHKNRERLNLCYPSSASIEDNGNFLWPQSEDCESLTPTRGATRQSVD